MPCGESALNLGLMRLIDEQFMETPFYCSRQMMRQLRRLGHWIGRMWVRRLMRRMGRLAALFRKPRTSFRHPERAITPYFLRDLTDERPNQVWCPDIPVRRGFLYLVAVMDWCTRKVLAWQVSNMMESRLLHHGGGAADRTTASGVTTLGLNHVDRLNIRLRLFQQLARQLTEAKRRQQIQGRSEES